MARSFFLGLRYQFDMKGKLHGILSGLVVNWHCNAQAEKQGIVVNLEN